jgi:DNA-binding winged helix-turn-helix (wHTH) protein/TolB-like protein
MEQVYRFGVFRFDAEHLELRRDGQPLRLQPQPAQVLAVLIRRAGGLVTREELHQAIWGDHTFVDFDRGLNFCIAQIRGALGDQAGTPRYVRTVPKKGYEFICPVSVESSATATEEPASPAVSRRTWGRRSTTALAGLGLAAAVVLVIYSAVSSNSHRLIVAVARFDNETGDSAMTRFSDNLTDTLVQQLAASADGSYEVIGNAAILRGARDQRDLRAISRALNARFIVLGQVQRDTDRVRVLGHLIRMPDQTHIAVARFDDVPDQTLARTDDIAARISDKFARRLEDPASR